MSKLSILADIVNKILSGGRRTTAANTRIVLNSIVEETYNINDAAAGTLDGTETVPLVQNGVSKSSTLNDVKTFIIEESDYIILRSTGADGHRWKFTCDDTGMISLPGEDLGV